jgi:UDP-glucose 4-epimerase
VQHLKAHAAFTCIVESVINRQAMAELVDDADIILHLAAAVGVRLVVESPIRTIETNIKGTEVVLELAAKKAKRVVIFSTSEVYGKSTRPAFSETDDLVLGPTTRSRWSYAASKIIDEFLALAYFKEKRLPITIVRLFNTVGPRQTGRYGMVIPRFVEQAQNARPITVYGSGSQTRTFIHVHDSIRAILALAECEGAIGEVFNIGGKETISIGGLANLVKELIGTASPIIFVPYDRAYEAGFEDMESRVPDTQKLQEQTGFEPQRTLRQIILDVAEYQKRFEDRVVTPTAGRGVS